MLVRLLQNFSSISLELDAFPPGTLPPDDFKLSPGRKGVEKVWPKSTLTLYVKVCPPVNIALLISPLPMTYYTIFRAVYGLGCEKLLMHRGHLIYTMSLERNHLCSDRLPP